MALFSYSFCMAMLHSLWQGALLWLLYKGFHSFKKEGPSPIIKRNFLFLLAGAQVLFFIITTLFYCLDTTASQVGSTLEVISHRVIPAGFLQQAAPWLFTAYLLIFLQRTAAAIYQWSRFKQQYRMGLQKPGIDLKLFTQQKAVLFGLKRKVTLWFSEHIHTPVTFGYLRPVILLPVTLVNRISTEQAETLILHELTHIRSNDYLLNWLLVITENVFFFNPFIHAIGNTIRLEREKYCDISVMAFDYTPVLYAETLLEAEKNKQQLPVFQLAAVHRKKQLLERIHFFTGNINYKKDKAANIWTPVLALLLLFITTASTFYNTRLIHNQAPVVLTAGNTVNSIPVDLAVNDAEGAIFSPEDIETLTATLNSPEIIASGLKSENIQAQLKEMEPYIRAVQQQAEAISNQFADNIIPVTYKEAIPSKQVIIREEGSGSNSSTMKVYRAIWQNGQWKLIPEWMVAAKERGIDTTLPSDSLEIKAYPEDQQ